jgi:spoIIIJ-associated protein
MSPIIEFESKNVEQALQKASEELNIPADKLDHDVISYGSTGIFGLVGTKKAKIRVTIPEETAKDDDGREYQKPKEFQEGVASILSETFGNAETISENSDGGSSKDPILLGKDVLKRLVDSITADAVVDVEKNGGNVLFNVSGGNTALLIGKRGQTLEAIQYLVEKIVNKTNDQRIRIQIDVEGYLKNRKERLEALALRLGEKVKRTGKPVTVGQFNAYDRRIIHLVLKEASDIRTHSMGDGYYRKLKIFPKKKRKKINRNKGVLPEET